MGDTIGVPLLSNDVLPDGSEGNSDPAPDVSTSPKNDSLVAGAECASPYEKTAGAASVNGAGGWPAARSKKDAF